MCLMVASLSCDPDSSIEENLEIPNEEVSFEQLVERREVKYQINESMPFSGYALKYHDNGQISLRASFLDGKKEGVWKYFHNNGELLKKETHPNRFDHIFVQTFDRNGNINGFWPREDSYSYIEESDYSNLEYTTFYDEMDEEIFYFRKNKATDLVTYGGYISLDNKLSGPTFLITNEDRVISVNWYEKDKSMGNDVYHANGELALSTQKSISGTLTHQNIFDDQGYAINYGSLEVYYKNGNPYLQANVAFGKLNGEAKVYLPHRYSILNFEEGLKEGEYKTLTYTDDNMSYLSEKGFFRAGNLHGRHFYYTSEGGLLQETNYNEGELLFIIRFDENGNRTECYDGSYEELDCENL